MSTETALARPDLSTPARQQPGAIFDQLAAQIVGHMVAPSSGRVYAQTFRAWRAWAEAAGLSPLDLWPAQVGEFLESAPTSRQTRQRQLSALRKLAQVLFVSTGDDTAERMMSALKLVTTAGSADAEGKRRPPRALTPDQAGQVLRVWQGDQPIQRRNAALIAVLFLTGLRRAETAALRWDDVDFENAVISVRHGKGDKAREVSVCGDLALETLQAWRAAQGTGRAFVFCSVGKGGKPGADRPISGTDVYRVVRATETIAGVEFRPHDARRTFITEALAHGTPLADAQAQAGHAQASTTLHYAQPVDARQRRARLKLGYA